jgi:hypothetical protein
MKREIREESDGSITLSVNFKLEGSMLEMEDHIQQMVNEMGLKATLAALEKFDTDGTPIIVGGKTLTSKGKIKKKSTRPTDAEK